MAEAGFWIVWGVPTRGRERQAVETLKESMQYFEGLAHDGRIERSDTVVLKPQSTEIGGFVLLQGTRQQIDSLRRDMEFQRWVNLVQLVADKIGIVDAWVDKGIPEALGLYEDALKQAGL
jgi:hypothetical protein